MREVSAYDIDGTLREGVMLKDAVHFGIENSLLDPSRFADLDHITMEEIGYFREALIGASKHTLKDLTDRISDEAVASTMEWGLERLDHHRKHGAYIVLVSQAADFLAKAYARGLGHRVDWAFGSYYHTTRGVFSGHAVDRAKVPSLHRHVRRRGHGDLVFAAGDSRFDIPMLQRAKEAAVVNPNEQLGALAIARGWEIIRTEAEA